MADDWEIQSMKPAPQPKGGGDWEVASMAPAAPVAPPTAQESAQQAGPATSMGADTRGVMQKLNDWYMRQSSTYGGTLNSAGKSPRQHVQEAAQGAGAASLPFIGAGALAAPVTTALGVGGGIGGGIAGGMAGQYVGNKLGAPELGQDVGAITGSLAGGYGGAKLGTSAPTLLRNPEGKIAISPSAVLDRMVPQRPEVIAKQQLAAREELLNQKAQSLMDRQAAQDKLDADFAARLKEHETMRQKELADLEKLRTQHAQSLADRQVAQDKLSTMKATPLSQSPYAGQQQAVNSEIQQAGATAAPSGGGSDIISRGRQLVLPGQDINAPSAADIKKAGDMTQVPYQALKILTKFKDPFAIIEMNRRIRMGLVPK